MCKDNADRMDRLEQRIGSLEKQLEEVKHDTGDLVEAFKAAQGGFRVLTWLGKLAAPLVAIGAAWASIKTGLWK